MMVHDINVIELEEDMVRHMILNSVRMYRTMFNEDYGEIVLAYDSRAYWRREVFPQYKSNRRKIEKKMIKIKIPYLMFLIISKKK